jgi:hypothetical protein
VLLSSHDLDFLAAWCDHGLLLSPGARAEELRGERWARWAAAPALAPSGGGDEE